jgi:hypothetical protein
MTQQSYRDRIETIEGSFVDRLDVTKTILLSGKQVRGGVGFLFGLRNGLLGCAPYDEHAA